MAHPTRPALPTLYKELTASETKKECKVTKNEFIPQEKLVEIITVPRVKSALRSRWSWLRSAFRNRGFRDRILQARKLIAILAMIGQLNEDSLKSLNANSLTDDDLPFSLNGEALQNRQGTKAIRFPTWEEAIVNGFLEKQFIVLAPILDLQDGHPIEVQLDKKCAFEFSKCENKGRTQFSSVFYAEIPPQKKEGNPRPVAIKRFLNGFKDYERERDNLRKINAIENDHLIKHLATCDQVRCIIFPWADHGDLKQYWEQNSTSNRMLHDFEWSMKQLSGLASALSELHKINLRHGDLKPSNIFYFKEGSGGILKIADVGISKVHSMLTDQRWVGTKTTASTRAYEGPEAYRLSNAPRSRKYDCWSMGCTILEFVIWLLYNQRAIEAFHDSRDSESNSYYRLKIPNPTHEDQGLDWLQRMERHPKVDEAIKLLHEDARVRGTALDELINLVDSSLLLIEPKDRLTADGIAEELQGLLRQCEAGEISWVNINELPPTIPRIFSQLRPQPLDTTYRPNGAAIINTSSPIQTSLEP